MDISQLALDSCVLEFFLVESIMNDLDSNIIYVEAIDISQLSSKDSSVVKKYEYIVFFYLSCSYCTCQEIHIAL